MALVVAQPARRSTARGRCLAVCVLAFVICHSGISFCNVNRPRVGQWQLGRKVEVGMQSEKVDKIIEEMKSLTLLEASELVKAIEETFGVDASASAGAVVMAGPAAGGGGEEEAKAEEKTEFDLVLKDVPKDKKIAILKVVRTITGLGLKEAKGLVDNPGKLLEGKPKEVCEDAKKQLDEAGASCEIA
mmetsp:Transcript_70535/g.131949  ORF Transcript_70535/g.131949 Transcript_70535/m.131949 type:complete len:188 (-) Transcript_70535:51-614(-)